MNAKQNHKKDLSYYITIYKLEGHQTWRAHFSGVKDGFELEKKNWSAQNHPPKITEIQVLRLDRITGVFSTS